MKRHIGFWAITITLMFAGCGGDDVTDESGGTGGSGGADSGSVTGDAAVAGTGGSAGTVDGGESGTGGEDAAAAGGDGAVEDGATAPGEPGTITVNADGITGHQNDGYLVLVAVSPVGEPQKTLGTACAQITSDPFSVPDTVIIELLPQDDSPCDASGGEKVFDPGDYEVLFVVIKGGEQVPEKSARLTVTVDGNVEVTAPDFTDWRGPDPNAQSGTITVNASGITGHENDGYILVIMAGYPNQPHAGLGSACAMLDSDPFSLPADATVLEGLAEGDSPCEASGGDKKFEGGDYDVTFSVIKAGEQVAEKSATVPAAVDGDITVTAPDYGTWQ